MKMYITGMTKYDQDMGYKFNEQVDVKQNSLGHYYTDDGHLFYKWQLVEQLCYEDIVDSIVESVINQFKQRSEAGIKKYNTTLERNDLNTLQWLTHLQEELMDATLYIERLKQEYDRD